MPGSSPSRVLAIFSICSRTSKALPGFNFWQMLTSYSASRRQRVLTELKRPAAGYTRLGSWRFNQ